MKNKAFEVCKVEFSSTGSSGTEQVFNRATKDDVTPAEYRLLEEIHGRNNVVVLKFDPEHIARETNGFEEPAPKRGAKKSEKVTAIPVYRPRTNSEEVDRLRRWYGQKVFRSVYSEKYPELPVSFEAAGIHTSLPDNVTDITENVSREDQARKLLKALSPKERNELLEEYTAPEENADPSDPGSQGQNQDGAAGKNNKG